MLWGTEDGFKKPEMLKDRKGNLMHTGRYWDPTTRKHTSGDGPGQRAYSALPVDWDGDGDFDLVVGTDKGSLFLRENKGTKKQPAFSEKLTEIRGRGKVVVPGGYAMPVAADWDGDGRVDLISGSMDGTVWWFRNLRKKKPMLAAPVAIAGPSSKSSKRGKKRRGKQRRGKQNQGAAGPTFRSQVEVADFDGDGDLDLLVGDYTQASGKSERHGYVWLYRRAGSKRQLTQARPQTPTKPDKK